MSWTAAEREHPVLAAYRSTDRGMDAAQLHGLAERGDSGARHIVRAVLPKLANIYRTKAAIEGKAGEVDPLTLNPVVQLTKQRMFVPPGTYRAGVVADLVEEAKDGGFTEWALEAISYALNLMMFVPGVGQAARGIAMAVDAGIQLYEASEEYAHYQVAVAAGDTNLDKVRSLSDEEPSLTGFAWRLVLAGIDLNEARHLIKMATGVRKLAIAGELDRGAVEALNTAGEANGLGKLGDEVADGARSELGAASKEGRVASGPETARRDASMTEESAITAPTVAGEAIAAGATVPQSRDELRAFVAEKYRNIVDRYVRAPHTARAEYVELLEELKQYEPGALGTPDMRAKAKEILDRWATIAKRIESETGVSQTDLRSLYNLVEKHDMPRWIEATAHLPKAKQAELLHMYREELRIYVRDLMTDENSKEILYLRDLAVSGRRGGPTFEKLYDTAFAKYQDADRAYDSIIDSAQRSNKDVNRAITGTDAGIATSTKEGVDR